MAELPRELFFALLGANLLLEAWRFLARLAE